MYSCKRDIFPPLFFNLAGRLCRHVHFPHVDVPTFLFLQDMDALDGDGGMLKDHAGTKASRDIVQFVPFSKYNLVSNFQQTTYVVPSSCIECSRRMPSVPRNESLSVAVVPFLDCWNSTITPPFRIRFLTARFHEPAYL